MKRYKLFLASSSELDKERKEIAILISKLNNTWTKQEKPVYLELVVWEDLLQSFRPNERIQDYFNSEMLKCDIVLALFYKKVGQFTKEEFDEAYKSLNKGNKPHYLFVYFKSGNVPIEEIDEDLLKIGKLKKEIQKDQQIYASFQDISDLILKIHNQLEMAIYDKQKNLLLESHVDIESKVLIDLDNYKQHLNSKFKLIDFTGLKAILQKPIELENIYVKLNIKIFTANNTDYIKKSKPAEKISKHYKSVPKMHARSFDFLFKEIYKEAQEKRQPLKLVILGPPGSGKSTLMKWIALQCLKTNQKEYFTQFLPVFISLKNLGNDPDHTFRQKNLCDLAVEFLKQENIPAESFLKDRLRAGQILFLLDGLDEIGDKTIRIDVIDWIQRQYIYQSSLIVTARTSGLNPDEGLSFKQDILVFEIQNFEMADVEEFLRNWYQNIEIAVGGESQLQKSIEKGEKHFNELIEVFKDEQRNNLRELAINPLLLTIIAVVHRTRAELPKERHKLYEECLKVMLELWNLANRKINLNFSYDCSMFHLAKIAVLLMEKGVREIDKDIIEAILPEIVEGCSRKQFVNEMVIKSGILYESEGKYGFSHLTFQEYLTAWYFWKYEIDKTKILKYRDRDYWIETIKLFVNIGNPRQFFKEITKKLDESSYWMQMNLWEDCLLELAVAMDIKKEIEVKLAKKIFSILMKLDYSESNGDIIVELSSPYIIYKYAEEFVKEGWKLFHNAKHPFVQSVGSFVLNKAGKKVQFELIEFLKRRIDEFDAFEIKSSTELMKFLYQNNNTFILLIAGREKLNDFSFVLEKLKTSKLFIIYLALRDLRDLRELHHLIGFRDLQGILYILNLLDLKYLIDRRDLRYLINLRNFNTLKNHSFLYLQKYENIIKEFKQDIEDIADQAIAKLHAMPDEELIKHFPGTTPEDLEAFRKGNY